MFQENIFSKECLPIASFHVNDVYYGIHVDC